MKNIIMGLCLVLTCAAGPKSFALTGGGRAEQEYGDAWAELGNWKRAVEHYRKAVKGNPKLAAARLRLANGLFRLGDKKGALSELARLQKEHPSAAVAGAIGVIQLDEHKAKKACRSFAHAVKLDPGHARSVYGLGQCHHALYATTGKPNQKKSALDAFRLYLSKFPKGPHAIPAREAIDKLLLGNAGKSLALAKDAFAKGKYRLAEKLLRGVVKERPDIEQAHYLLGMTLSSPVINKVAEAQQEWKKAPGMKQALLQLGIAAFEDEDFEDCQDLLKQAIKVDPRYAEAYYQLGLAYRDQLKNKEAADAFSRVVSLAPGTALSERANSKLQLITGKLQYLTEGEIIDTSSEIGLGRKLTEQIEKHFGLVNDQKLQQRLNAIIRKVAAHSDRPPSALPYRVKILNVDGINALAFVGGTVYLYKGLTDFIRRDMGDSDDIYAAVIGHEVVHLVMRHGLGMLDLVGGTRALTGGHSFDVRGLNKLMLGLSRKHEFEADQIGSLYAYRAGFDPAAAYRFHRRLIALGKEIPGGLDHPTHAERAERMKEYLLSLRTKARHFDAGLKDLDNRDYESAILHFEVFLGMFPQSLSARNNLGVAMQRLALSIQKKKRGYKLSSDIDPRAHVRPIRLRGADSDFDKALMIEAAHVFGELVRRNPDYQSACLNLGSCLVALDEKDKARVIFQGVLTKMPDSPEARTNLAVTYLMADEREKGIEMLRETIKKHPAFADALYDLALALTRSGKKGEARKAWLAFLERDASSGWAEAARKYMADLNK